MMRIVPILVAVIIVCLFPGLDAAIMSGNWKLAGIYLLVMVPCALFMWKYGISKLVLDSRQMMDDMGRWFSRKPTESEAGNGQWAGSSTMNSTPIVVDNVVFSNNVDIALQLVTMKKRIDSFDRLGSLCQLRSGSSDLTLQLSKIMLACPQELEQHPRLMGFFWTDERILLIRGEFFWNQVAPLVMSRRIYERKWLGFLVRKHQKGIGEVYTFSELVETTIGFSLKSGFHLLQNWGYPSFRVLR